MPISLASLTVVPGNIHSYFDVPSCGFADHWPSRAPRLHGVVDGNSRLRHCRSFRMFPFLIEKQLALYRISCLYSKVMMEATEFYDATAEEASVQFGNVVAVFFPKNPSQAGATCFMRYLSYLCSTILSSARWKMPGRRLLPCECFALRLRLKSSCALRRGSSFSWGLG